MTLELKSLKREALELLEEDGWTIEKLATTTVKKLIVYTGIGRVGAAKAIAEAVEILNEQGLEDAEQLAKGRYYQKASLARVLTDWEDEGLDIQDVALASSRALAALKGIGEDLAIRLISKAQGLVNERGLYESKAVPYGGTPRETSAAFPTAWLSGAEEPPPMSTRVRRLFDRAKKAYRQENPDIYTGPKQKLTQVGEGQERNVIGYEETESATLE